MSCGRSRQRATAYTQHRTVENFSHLPTDLTDLGEITAPEEVITTE